MIQVFSYRPEQLTTDEWGALQQLEYDAYRTSLPPTRTDEEIYRLVGMDAPQRYVDTHVNPMLTVGTEFRANQLHRNPLVVIARRNGELAGYGYATDNTSGENQRIREQKYKSVIKRYRWIRTLVTNPRYRQQGVGTAVARRILRNAHPLQPVTVYTWPDEDPDFLAVTLASHGFRADNPEEGYWFGDQFEPAAQTRMHARFAGGVLLHSYAHSGIKRLRTDHNTR